eukprot:scaffold19102_cov172-Amphora_coffeaeformis.AAC.2
MGGKGGREIQGCRAGGGAFDTTRRLQARFPVRHPTQHGSLFRAFLKDRSNVGAVVHAFDGGHDERRVAAPRGAGNHADTLAVVCVGGG